MSTGWTMGRDRGGRWCWRSTHPGSSPSSAWASPSAGAGATTTAAATYGQSAFSQRRGGGGGGNADGDGDLRTVGLRAAVGRLARPGTILRIGADAVDAVADYLAVAA